MAEDIKYDKLGRKIPQFDRSAAAKKAVKTKEKKYGPNHSSRVAALGGRKRTRGYFGKLKDEGDTDTIKKLASEAGKKSGEARKAKKRPVPMGKEALESGL